MSPRAAASHVTGPAAVLLVLGVQLLPDRVGEGLRPEADVLGFLDELLVRRHGLLTHDDVALRRVDLGVQVRLPDQVDDPPLGLLGLHVQFLRQHVDADHLVDTAERLERHQPGVLNEVGRAGDCEEVV